MWFFLACTIAEHTDTAAEPSPGGHAAAYCSEVSRVAVDDPYTPAEGFDFAASDVVYDNVGDWYGTFEYATTGTASGRVTMHYGAGGIFAVEQELVDPGGADTGPAMGAPDPYCPSYYQIDLDLSLHVGNAELAEENLPVSMVAVTRASPTLLLTVALEDLAGSATPSWDPRDWAHNTLYADAYRADDTWVVTVGWWGTAEATSRHAASRTSADSGEVAVSGVSESFGRMELWLDSGC